MKHNILYSFRRCPFAIRARWALLNTDQSLELREVELKKKPLELIEISKKATVPVLQTYLNEVIDESLDIMIWAIKKANMYELLGAKKESNNSEEIFSLIKTNDKIFKYHLDRFKYASRFNNQDSSAHHDEGMKILISLNKRLEFFSNKGKPIFLIDAKESLADWAIWPFVRQFRIADIKRFDENHKIRYLKKWLNYYFDHESYPLVMKKIKPWCKEQDPEIFGKSN